MKSQTPIGQKSFALVTAKKSFLLKTLHTSSTWPWWQLAKCSKLHRRISLI